MPKDLWHKIYCLSVGDSVRYVGKTTKTLTVRLQQHLAEARKSTKHSHRVHWLRKHGPDVEIFLVGYARGSGAAEEQNLIAGLRALGVSLVNATDGGEGKPGYKASAQTRLKQRQAKLGRKLSEEHRRRIGEAGLGRKLSVETRAKMSACKMGVVPSEATRQIWSRQRKGTNQYTRRKAQNA